MDLRIQERRPTNTFRESKPRSGNREAILIEAGWGSSGYYSEEMLGEYGPTAWPAGTHMHLDHPTMTEDVDKPEGSIKDWVGVVAAPPRMAGIQLVSEVEVFDHWKPVINSIAEHVGLSVMAGGEFEHGDAAGKHGPIVKEIYPNELNRVDYVTLAGAGGKLGNLIESARGEAGEYDEEGLLKLLESIDDPSKLQVFISKATDLSDKLKETSGRGSDSNERSKVDELERVQNELSEAKSKISDLEGKVEDSATKLTEAHRERDEAKDRADRAEDALLSSGAKSIAREAISQIEGLPERAADRAVEAAVRGDLPKDESGKLITEKVKETALSKAREELEYLAGEKIEGDLPLKESGSESSSSSTTTTTSNNGGSSEDAKKKLQESFQRAGLTEEQAKTAAEGR